MSCLYYACNQDNITSESFIVLVTYYAVIRYNQREIVHREDSNQWKNGFARHVEHNSHRARRLHQDVLSAWMHASMWGTMDSNGLPWRRCKLTGSITSSK